MVDVYLPELGASVDVFKAAVRSNEAPYRMWLCLGQSNMSGGNGTGDPASKLKGEIDSPLPNLYQVDNDLKIVPGRLPFQSDALDIPTYVGANYTVSLSMAFGKALALESTTDRILIAHVAFPGSSFSQASLPAGQWRSPSTGLGGKLANNLYDRTIAKANAAIALGAVLEGILWCQGENDAEALTQVQYTTELTALHKDLIANISADVNGGHTQKPFIVISMPAKLLGTGSTSTPGPLPGSPDISEAEFKAIEDGKIGFCLATPYTAYVESRGLLGDPLHYTAAELRALGKRCFAAITRALENVRNEPYDDGGPKPGVPRTDLPAFRWDSFSGHGARADIGVDNIRASGWNGAAISDFVNDKLAIVGAFNGDGTGTVDTPIAKDGAHVFARRSATTANAGFSAVAENGAAATPPEWRLRCDGLVGVLGVTEVIGTAGKIEIARNGTTEFIFEATTGDLEITSSAQGLILKSANGNRWRLTISNAGAGVITAL